MLWHNLVLGVITVVGTIITVGGPTADGIIMVIVVPDITIMVAITITETETMKEEVKFFPYWLHFRNYTAGRVFLLQLPFICAIGCRNHYDCDRDGRDIVCLSGFCTSQCSVPFNILTDFK